MARSISAASVLPRLDHIVEGLLGALVPVPTILEGLNLRLALLAG